MKINKSILAVALGLSVAASSHAGEVFLTGSTAMRSTVFSALTNVGTVFQSAPAFYGFGGKGNGDNYMAFVGTLVGGSGTTTINCDWSGSENGILCLASNATVTQVFMADSIWQSGSPSDNSASTPPTTQTAACHLAMADNNQAFSRTKTPVLNNGTEVGIITFEWVRNPGLWTGGNITDSMINQALVGGGGAKRAVFDGVATDTNDYIFVSGRDSSSGTRVNAFGDSGFGILTTPAQVELAGGVMQVLATSTNRSGVVTSTYSGDFGFSSGGTLAGTLGSSTTGSTDFIHSKTGFSVVAYLGVSDGDTAVTAGATVLSYDGVPFLPANVLEGTYTFWGNEYIYEANNVASGSEADNIYKLLTPVSTGISSFCDGRKAIALAAMHCTRQGPTSYPSH
jgi:hypothetical protein